jgi:hypothetical protein
VGSCLSRQYAVDVSPGFMYRATPFGYDRARSGSEKMLGNGCEVVQPVLVHTRIGTSSRRQVVSAVSPCLPPMSSQQRRCPRKAESEDCVPM